MATSDEPTTVMRHRRSTDVHLPRSLVIALVVAVLAFTMSGLIGAVFTSNQATRQIAASRQFGRCSLLQALEMRASQYAHGKAEAAMGGYNYDRLVPDDSPPPDLSAVRAELGDACESLVPAGLLNVNVPTTTTTTARPGPAGPTGPVGRAGRSGRDAPATTTVANAPPPSSTSTTSRPLVTLPIVERRYADGMKSTAISWGMVCALLGLLAFARLRLYRFHLRVRSERLAHPAGRAVPWRTQ